VDELIVSGKMKAEAQRPAESAVFGLPHWNARVDVGEALAVQGNTEQVEIRHSRAGGNPGNSRNWISASKGITTYLVFPQDLT
jgi:hypothetical protein